MGIASKMQECSFHISGLRLPECSKHVTQHRAGGRVGNVRWWHSSLSGISLAPAGLIVWLIAHLIVSQRKESARRGGTASTIPPWPQMCQRAFSSLLFAAISEKWPIWKGSLSLELLAVNLAQGCESETPAPRSDHRRHRQRWSWETISSFSRHQKNVPSANVTTLKRTGKRLVRSLKWETDNCVLSLLWQYPLLTEPEKSNRSMNYRDR